MLMYSDQLQSRLKLIHGLLIFLILSTFWLSETCQICGFGAYSWERMVGMSWNLACCCILTIFRLDFGHGLLIFLILSCLFRGSVPIWLAFGGVSTNTYINLLDFYPVISEKMKKANFSIWKSSSYQVGVSLITIYSDFSDGASSLLNDGDCVKTIWWHILPPWLYLNGCLQSVHLQFSNEASSLGWMYSYYSRNVYQTQAYNNKHSLSPQSLLHHQLMCIPWKKNVTKI